MSIVKTFLKLLLGKGMQKSFSQYGEDVIMRPFLKGKEGFYVDVGCYHPMLYSNTYKLYRQGWKGIVIDPNYRLKKLFSVFRPRDTFIHAGVGAPSERVYFEFSDGAYNTFDAHTAEGYKKKTTLVASYPVPIRSLKDILSGVERIDFLTVDVEGMDLEVLQSYDWATMPWLIAVEAPFGSPVHQYLTGKEYTLIGLTPLNLIFKYAPLRNGITEGVPAV